MSDTGERFVVVCDDYRTAPLRTQELAERKLQLIEEGGHCYRSHSVVRISQCDEAPEVRKAAPLAGRG